jgi:large subunit ribosomal protein L17
MLSNMASSLLIHKRIQTTLAKAKVLRRYVEPLITKSKKDLTHNRRIVFSYLQNKYAVKALFTEIAPAIAERPGGYTRILKLGPRQGDNAEMALIELVDFNPYLEGDSIRKKTRRQRKKDGVSGAIVQSRETVGGTGIPHQTVIEDDMGNKITVKVTVLEETPVVDAVYEEVADVTEVAQVAEVVEETAGSVEAIAAEASEADTTETPTDSADESADKKSDDTPPANA